MTRVVLLGMMGAGKTTVGRLLADRLAWTFVDLDREIERAAGQPIPEIFATGGEPAFRRIETACTARLAGSVRTVLSTGGGWATTPGNLDLFGPGTLTAWLQVTPEEAVQRVGRDATIRPLLRRADPLAAIRELAARREPGYARADLAIQTLGRTPAELADLIIAELRSRTHHTGDPEYPES